MVRGKSISVELCTQPIDWENYKNLKLPSHKPWTEEDWSVHEKIFNRLAKPKQMIKPEPVVRQKAPLQKLLPRIEKLAKPKDLRIRTKNRKCDPSMPVIGMKF